MDKVCRSSVAACLLECIANTCHHEPFAVCAPKSCRRYYECGNVRLLALREVKNLQLLRQQRLVLEWGHELSDRVPREHLWDVAGDATRSVGTKTRQQEQARRRNAGNSTRAVVMLRSVGGAATHLEGGEVDVGWGDQIWRVFGDECSRRKQPLRLGGHHKIVRGPGLLVIDDVLQADSVLRGEPAKALLVELVRPTALLQPRLPSFTTCGRGSPRAHASGRSERPKTRGERTLARRERRAREHVDMGLLARTRTQLGAHTHRDISRATRRAGMLWPHAQSARPLADALADTNALIWRWQTMPSARAPLSIVIWLNPRSLNKGQRAPVASTSRSHGKPSSVSSAGRPSRVRRWRVVLKRSSRCEMLQPTRTLTPSSKQSLCSSACSWRVAQWVNSADANTEGSSNL